MHPRTECKALMDDADFAGSFHFFDTTYVDTDLFYVLRARRAELHVITPAATNREVLLINFRDQTS